MPTLDRIPEQPTRTRRALGGIGSDFIPYIGAIKSVDLGAFNFTTTGLGTFGNLDVDTLNLNGNVISDSGGTISFDDDNLTTTGNITGDIIYISNIYSFLWVVGSDLTIVSQSDLILNPYSNTVDLLDNRLTTTGVIDADGLTIGATGGGTITDIKNEDNMVSDSQTALATQQSIKAYVDTTLSSGFVPYTGANANVDLGSYTLTTGTLTLSDGSIVDSDGTLSIGAGGGADTLNLTTSNIYVTRGNLNIAAGDLSITNPGILGANFIVASSGTLDVSDDNITTSGTITSGYDVVNQTADSQGLQISGYDDKSAANIKLYVDASGNGFIDASGLLITRSQGANVGFFTQYGYGYYDNKIVYIGSTSATNAGFKLSTAQTPSAPVLFVSDDAGSRSFIIADKADRDFDFSHAQQNTPTLFIHSDAQSTTEWIGLTHDGTRAVITSGAGGLSLAAATTIGDGGTTNYMAVSATGDVIFVGSAGLAYGELSAYDEGDTIALGGAGIANKAQITTFDVSGPSNNMTPSVAQSHITVDVAGHYLCTVSIHMESTGGGGAKEFGFAVYKNNGTTLFENCHAHRKVAGGGGDTGSVSISGILDLAVSDTIEVWCWNEDDDDDIVIDDITLTLVQIGGT